MIVTLEQMCVKTIIEHMEPAQFCFYLNKHSGEGEQEIQNLMCEATLLFTCGSRYKLLFPTWYIQNLFSKSEQKCLKAMYNFLKQQHSWQNNTITAQWPPSLQQYASDLLQDSYELSVEKCLKSIHTFLKQQQNVYVLQCQHDITEHWPPSSKECADEILKDPYEVYLLLYTKLFGECQCK